MTAPAGRLFVYGTLRRRGGAPAALSWLESLPREPARVAGVLLDLGAYPGWRPRGGGSGYVRGELVAIDAARWAPLDRYEGFDPGDPAASLFVRERVRAWAATGEVACWIYRYAGPCDGLSLVPGGDWLASRAGGEPG